MLFLCAAITWCQSAQIQLPDSLLDVLDSPRFAPIILKDHQSINLWMGLSLLKKSNLSFSAMDIFHSSIPPFGEMEFDIREIWSFCYHSHFQPLSPAHFFGFIFVLDLNPVSRWYCCIGCIPTSFILCSSPHLTPIPPSCSPLGVIFPPFLIFSPGELERPRPLTAVSGSVLWWLGQQL